MSKTQLVLLLVGAAVLIALVRVPVRAVRKPDALLVQHSIEIAAPPATVFALIDDFHHCSQWAPQDREEPSMQRTYSGAPSGSRGHFRLAKPPAPARDACRSSPVSRRGAS